jgi:hypothetical protein
MLEALVKDLLKLIITNAPTLIPEVKRVVQQWGKAANAPHESWTDLIDHIEKDHFGQVDSDIDAKIAGLNLPDK